MKSITDIIIQDDLKKSSCRLSFGEKVGNLLPDLAKNDLMEVSSTFNRVPGIMLFHVAPLACAGATNQLNTAAAKMYASLRHKISGAASIQKSDYMIYLLCGGSLMSSVQFLKRIYGLAFEYKTYNRYFGDPLLKSLGVDVNSVASQLEDFRGYINRFIGKVNALNFPKLPLFERWAGINGTIYLDSPDVSRSQMYVYDMDVFYKWNAVSSEQGTIAEAVFFNETPYQYRTVSQIMTFFDSLVDTMLNDDDCINISAWVENLFGENLAKAGICDESHTVEIKSGDSKALSVIENTVIATEFDPITTTEGQVSGFSVVQDSAGNVLQYCSVDLKSASHNDYLSVLAVDKLINMHVKHPSEDDIALAMQFKCDFKFTSESNTLSKIELVACGSEIVYDMSIVTSPTLNNRYYDVGGIIKDMSYQTPQDTWDILTILECFDYHPLIPCASVGTDEYYGGKIESFMYFGDLDNYRVIETYELQNINTAMWFGLLGLNLV